MVAIYILRNNCTIPPIFLVGVVEEYVNFSYRYKSSPCVEIEEKKDCMVIMTVENGLTCVSGRGRQVGKSAKTA